MIIKKILSFLLESILSKLINNILNKRDMVIIFRNGPAVGDHVYLSSIINKINTQTNKKIILFSNHFNIFLNNPRIYKLFQFKNRSYIWFFLRKLKGDSIFEFNSIHSTKEHHFLNKKIFL